MMTFNSDPSSTPRSPLPGRQPKISVLSPSFNCAGLIRRCVDSVRSQNYPAIEHIIVDGASTDGTVDILKSYSHLRWISEPDNGEACALNKALAMATGEILTWLNVDDCYFGSNVFAAVAKAARENTDCDVFYGNVLQVDDLDHFALLRAPMVPVTLAGAMRWFNDLNTFQPAIFYTNKLIEKTGLFREDLHFGIDLEYMLRNLALGFKYHYIDQVLAKATLFRSGAKSSASYEEQHNVWYQLCTEYQHFLPDTERKFYWRDYYKYRIKYHERYKDPVNLPLDKAEMQGFLIAILESDVLENAVLVVDHMLKLYPDCPDTYWLLSEIFYKLGQTEKSKELLQHGSQLALSKQP